MIEDKKSCPREKSKDKKSCPLIAKKAKENQAEYHGNQYDGLSQKSVKVQKPIDTQKELASIAGVRQEILSDLSEI